MAFQLRDGLHWWAVHTRANFERTVEQQLAGRGLEAFLPTYRTFSQRKDRRQVISLPLFAGYVFVHTELAKFENRVAVLRARGVVQIVGTPGGPEPVPDWEIDNVVRLCQSDRLLEPWGHLEAGTPVRVVSGALAGVTGIIVEVKGKGRRLICSIELLGRAVAAELRPEDVEALNRFEHQ